MDPRRNEYAQPIGPAIADWKPRPLPSREPMTGRYCTIRPVDVDADARELYEAYAEASDGRDWTYLFAGPFATYESYRDHLAQSSKAQDPFHHTIVDVRSGKPVGTAALMRIEPAHGVIEVGHITYSPRIQRSPAATEAMFLLMRRAFDELGYRRYEWKCDDNNLRSRAAALRYGFTFEGIFRQAIVYKGRSRDTAWYSIVDHEWPAIKQGFEQWLDPSNFDAEGRQRRKLADLITVARGKGGW